MEIQPRPPNEFDAFVQEYAKGGIAAVILLNGGASVALLSQIDKMLELGLKSPSAYALTIWSIGIVLGALTWLMAMASSRHASRSLSPYFRGAHELRVSDLWMYAGIASMLASLASFALGVFLMAWAFSGADNKVDLDAMKPWERYELLQELKRRLPPGDG